MSNHPTKKEFQRQDSGLISTQEPPERALLGHLEHGLDQVGDDEHPLDELAGLAEAAGVEVVGAVEQKRDRPDPATFFGTGKVEELAQMIEEQNIEVFIVDTDLAPAQGRNLESKLKCRVIDRTELILDIFARRAQTRQAKMQVELAQLRYQLPRLKRMWSHLERQGGGLGLRGPGETQLETDKTLARGRISLLEKQLSTIRRQKTIERAGRHEFDLGALVGYTNVGKSALLNALSRPTGRGVLEADMLFATLGATTRRVELGGGRAVLLSDTVGLVRRLPHNLVESFHSTLAEVKDADFLLRVINASDPELEEKEKAVREVLEELDVTNTSHLLVLNQSDLLSDEQRRDLERRHPDAVFTSALTGEGLDELRERIVTLLDESAPEIEFALDAGDEKTGRVLSQLARYGVILEQEWTGDEDGHNAQLCVRARLLRRWWETVGVPESLAVHS